MKTTINHLFFIIFILLLACDNKSISEMFEKANYYERKGDIKTANIIFDEIIRDYDECAGAFINKGVNFSEQEETYKALFTYKNGLKRFPNNLVLNMNTAYSYDKLNKPDSANIYFSSAIKYANRCETYDGIQLTILDADDLNGVGSYELYYERALNYFEMKEYNKCISDMRECIRCGFYVSHCHYIIGLSLDEMGNFEESCVEFHIASDLGDIKAKEQLESKCPEDLEYGADVPLSVIKSNGYSH